MRKIEQTSAFKRDFKRIAKSHYRKNLQADFKDVLEALVNDNVLAEKYHDHALTGEWKDFKNKWGQTRLISVFINLNVTFTRFFY